MKLTVQKDLGVFGVLLSLAVFSQTAGAALLAITPPLVSEEIVPVDSVQVGQHENDSKVFFVTEGAGTFDGTVDENLGGISSGAQVESHYFYYDPADNTSTFKNITFRATFSDPIVGIIYDSISLDDTDSVYGLAGITYPTGEVLNPSGTNVRGMENVNNNVANADLWALVGGDGKAIDITFNVKSLNNIDSIRILTAVPIPPAVLLFGSALVGLSLVGRRKNSSAS